MNGRVPIIWEKYFLLFPTISPLRPEKMATILKRPFEGNGLTAKMQQCITWINKWWPTSLIHKCVSCLLCRYMCWWFDTWSIARFYIIFHHPEKCCLISRVFRIINSWSDSELTIANLIISPVPADGLAPVSAKPSKGSMITLFESLFMQPVQKSNIIPGLWWLKYWSRDKMCAILQMTFSNAFSSMKIYAFRLRCHRIFSEVHINNIPGVV